MILDIFTNFTYKFKPSNKNLHITVCIYYYVFAFFVYLCSKYFPPVFNLSISLYFPNSQGLSNSFYSEPNQSSSSYCYLFLQICSNIRQDLQKVSIKILKALLPSTILSITPYHIDLLHLIVLTIFGERYKTMNFLIMKFPPFRILINLGPNILLRIRFRNILSLHSFLNLRDLASQSNSNILILKFLANREEKSVWTK